MKFYLAPLEGLTGYIYRNAYETFFGEIDKYFTPFISPNQHSKFSSREKQDVAPLNNDGKYVVPQILTNDVVQFVRTTKQLMELGYNEVNLNLGCPSGTVVSKRKGSGFLAYPEELEAFLEGIFSENLCKISIKTRIGKEQPEEFEKLLKIFNQYPAEELIIHPRVQKDYYKNTPNKQVFLDAVNESTQSLCYNGDLFSKEDYEQFKLEFQTIGKVMIGRGILANPSLILAIKHGQVLEKDKLWAFHNKLYRDYQEVMSGERNVLFKMKEMWFYMGNVFVDADKLLKQVKKAQTLQAYEAAVYTLFESKAIAVDAKFSPVHSKKML